MLYKNLLIAASFISNLGEKTAYGDNRGCQIDKKKIIWQISEEFFSIKVLCIKYILIFLSSCDSQDKPLINEYKFVMLQNLHDFISNTNVVSLMTSVMEVFERIQELLDDPYDRINMEIFLSSILESKHHQLAKLEELKSEVKREKSSNRGSRRNSLSKKDTNAARHRAGQRLTDLAVNKEVSVPKTNNSILEDSYTEGTVDLSTSQSSLEAILANCRLRVYLAKGVPRFAGSYELAKMFRRDEGIIALIDMIINPFDIPLAQVVVYRSIPVV